MSLTVKLDAKRYWALRDFCASGRDEVVELSEIERRYRVACGRAAHLTSASSAKPARREFMKYPIATLVATALLIIVCGRFVFAADLLVYLDQEFRFRVEYPASWERRGTTGTSIRLMAHSKDGDTCFFDVGAAPKSKGREPAKLVSGVLEGDALQKLLRKSMPNAEVVSTQRTRFGNQAAAFMVFTATSEEATLRTPWKGMGVLTWRNGYSYGGTCITQHDRYSTMEALFKGILGTFVFTR